jgi:acetyltransferase-like isoleucine patch superfamily enzyme
MRRVVLRARFTRPYWRRRFRRFGDNSILHRPDWVYGPHQIEIGNNVVILKSIWLAVERVAWGTDPPVLRIGDGVAIRPYCTISAAESIDIGDGVVLSAFSTVIDSDHVHADTSTNVVWGGKLATSPIRIGQGTWIGERVAVLRGSEIGAFCTIGSNSVVRGTIPDYSIAVGSPARVVGSTREAKTE